jgi:hypothetical protein
MAATIAATIGVNCIGQLIVTVDSLEAVQLALKSTIHVNCNLTKEINSKVENPLQLNGLEPQVHNFSLESKFPSHETARRVACIEQ